MDTLDPALQPLLRELVEKWGSIQREQLLRLRQAPGASRPEQTAHVLADLYDKLPAPIGLHKAEMDWAFTDVNQMLPFISTPRKPEKIERILEDG